MNNLDIGGARPGSGPSILYIMGRGHSGSTVLDGLLGNCADVESVGELVSGLSRWPEEICSCGQQIDGCDYWTAVIDEAFGTEKNDREVRDIGQMLLAQANFTQIFRTLLAPRSTARSRDEVAAQAAITAAISRTSGSSTIVDSTKEYTRAAFLLRFFPRTKTIHLVRNPVAIAASYEFRLRQGMPFKMLRHKFFPPRQVWPIAFAILGFTWMIGIVTGWFLSLVFRSRIMAVRFEDICDDPAKSLQRIAEFAGIDAAPLAESIAQGQTFKLGHNIGGNEMRHQQTFTFKADSKSRRKRSLILRISVFLFAWPGMLAFRYRP